ncbi:unnamed protein product [Moneuplotes crassus]|uniref:1-alkyl-2-acetylglycerophosphocholine esterase n=1 Tax=Euplotes crassus TaxID=5936 RepID=A0AAD1UCU0_EUPCR|nr:unnamed protein product [Moneuplotes crassus]
METRYFCTSFEKNVVAPGFFVAALARSGVLGDTLGSFLCCAWSMTSLAVAMCILFDWNCLDFIVSARATYAVHCFVDIIMYWGLSTIIGDYGMISLLISFGLLASLIHTSKHYVYNATGPYGVGVRDIVVKGKTTPPVCIFYPIDKEEYLQNIDNEERTHIALLDGEDAILGRVQGAIQAFEIPISKIAPRLPTSISLLTPVARDYYLYRIRAIIGSKLHKDFETGHKKLTPVIISHGISSCREHFVTLASMLASYGCIVYTLNHTDGSSIIGKDYSVKGSKHYNYNYYDRKKKVDSFGNKYEHDEFRLKFLNGRMDDIETVLDYIKDQSIKEYKHIDLDKIVSMGHSMGGMTCIEMAKKFDKDFKICISFDPYFCARHKDIEKSDDYYIKQPLALVNTYKFDYSPFMDYDQVKVHKKFITNCRAKGSKEIYDIELEDSAHLSCIDEALINTTFTNLINMIGKASTAGERLEEHGHIALSFLEKNGFLPVNTGLKPNQHLE